MCVVSMIADDYRDRNPFGPAGPYRPLVLDPYRTEPWALPSVPEVSKEEFEALKKELEALKEVLKAAKIYDEVTGQPECEVEEKVEFLKQMADYLDVDLEDIL